MLVRVVSDMPYISEKDHVNYWQCFVAAFYEEVEGISVKDQPIEKVAELLFAHPRLRLRCLFEEEEES